MLELFEIWLVLAVLYLSECLCWANAGEVFLVTSFLGKLQVKEGSRIFGTTKGGLILLNPFPCAINLRLHRLNLTFGSERVGVTGSDDSEPLTEVRYDQLESIQQLDNVITLRPGITVRMSSRTAASRITELLRELRATSVEGRPPLIESFVQKFYSVDSIRTIIADYSSDIDTLLTYCQLQFILIFAGLPTTFVSSNLALSLIILLAVVTAIHFLIVYNIKKLISKHSVFLSEVPRNMYLKLAFYPLAALRACDCFSIDLLDRFESVAVVLALAEKSQAQTILDREFTRRLLAVESTDQIDAQGSAETGNWDLLALRRLEAIAQTRGLSLKNVVVEQFLQDESVASICPNCLTPYTRSEGECSDCHGVLLRRIRR